MFHWTDQKRILRSLELLNDLKEGKFKNLAATQVVIYFGCRKSSSSQSLQHSYVKLFS